MNNLSSIINKIRQLGEYLDNIRQSIIDKNVEVPEDTPKSEYSNKIEEINQGLSYTIDYEIDGDGGTITSSDFKFSEDIVLRIPTEIDGYAILKVGKDAYACNSLINKVIIPDSILRFEGGTANDNFGAFRNCRNLVEVQISNNYYGRGSIGDYAFAGCKNLRKVPLLSYYGNYISKGKHAFDGCDLSETDINLSDQSDVGEYCFANTKISNVYLHGSSWWGTEAEGLFYNCQDLVECHTNMPAYHNRFSVYAYSFYNCKKLIAPDFLPWLYSVGEYAFYGCVSLVAAIEYPLYIQEYAFAYSGITSVKFSGDSYGGARFAKGAFLNCKNLECIEIYTWANSNALVFEDGSIGGCTALTTIKIPSFGWWNNLSEVGHIGITAGEVDGVQYEGCTSLTDIYYGGSESDEKWQLFIAANPIPETVTVHFNNT